MSKKTFSLGTKNTTGGHPGGIGHKGYVVDTKSDMAEITPRTAQTNKKNYAKTKSGKQGRG